MALIEKDADAALAGTVTEAGTVNLSVLDTRATVASPEPVTALSVRAQEELRPLSREEGLQDREVRIGEVVLPVARLTVPPVGEMARGSPAGEAPRALLTPSPAVVASGVKTTDTMATAPLPIVFPLSPETMQM